MALAKKKLQHLAMILSFVYAGVCALLFLYQGYSLIRTSIAPPPAFRFNRTIGSIGAPPEFEPEFGSFRRVPVETPMILIASFLGMAISTFAGFTLLDMMGKKEKTEITSQVMEHMLMPEEKLLIKLLEETGGEVTQSELVKRSKLSKLKVSRVIQRLESLNVVSKYPYGVTNKIVLDKGFSGAEDE